jgi:predicted dehydrogenase
MSDSRSRRDFLKKGAAAAAAATIITRSARAAAEEYVGDDAAVPQASARPKLADNDQIRIGVIGTGGMGGGHCDALTKLASSGRVNARIEALSDVCQPRLAAMKARVEKAQGGAEVATYADYRDVLRRADIHAVLIATPEHWHAKMGEEAIKAGKDIYIEKPMTLNLKEALRLQKVAHANPDVVVVVGTQFVMTPSYQAAKKLIAEGAIGKPVWSQTSYCRNSKEGEWTYYRIDPDWQPGVNLDWDTWCGPLGKAKWDPEIYARWRRYKKYSSGIIGDLLVHHMTPTIAALNVGWPVRVIGSGGHYVDKKMENFDQVNLTVEFEKEHTMVVAGSTCNELGFERVIRGNKGNLFVGGRTAIVRPERIYAEEVDEREIPAPANAERNDQDALRLHWLECVRTRQKPASDVDLGTQVMVIVDLAQRSMWEGAAFEYDPAKQKVKKLS